ncbi:Nitrogen permease regulator 2 [Gonapodya sp. JEL0774]|nr:Nitrogen permease regulator 2 [Gonapodya sp. JEL0774]
MAFAGPQRDGVKFARIMCLVYCEFHPTEGSRIVFQTPEGFFASGGSSTAISGITGVPATSSASGSATVSASASVWGLGQQLSHNTLSPGTGSGGSATGTLPPNTSNSPAATQAPPPGSRRPSTSISQGLGVIRARSDSSMVSSVSGTPSSHGSPSEQLSFIAAPGPAARTGTPPSQSLVSSDTASPHTANTTTTTLDSTPATPAQQPSSETIHTTTLSPTAFTTATTIEVSLRPSAVTDITQPPLSQPHQLLAPLHRHSRTHSISTIESEDRERIFQLSTDKSLLTTTTRRRGRQPPSGTATSVSTGSRRRGAGSGMGTGAGANAVTGSGNTDLPDTQFLDDYDDSEFDSAPSLSGSVSVSEHMERSLDSLSPLADSISAGAVPAAATSSTVSAARVVLSPPTPAHPSPLLPAPATPTADVEGSGDGNGGGGNGAGVADADHTDAVFALPGPLEQPITVTQVSAAEAPGVDVGREGGPELGVEAGVQPGSGGRDADGDSAARGNTLSLQLASSQSGPSSEETEPRTNSVVQVHKSERQQFTESGGHPDSTSIPTDSLLQQNDMDSVAAETGPLVINPQTQLSTISTVCDTPVPQNSSADFPASTSPSPSFPPSSISADPTSPLLTPVPDTPIPIDDSIALASASASASPARPSTKTMASRRSTFSGGVRPTFLQASTARRSTGSLPSILSPRRMSVGSGGIPPEGVTTPGSPRSRTSLLPGSLASPPAGQAPPSLLRPLTSQAPVSKLSSASLLAAAGAASGSTQTPGPSVPRRTSGSNSPLSFLALSPIERDLTSASTAVSALRTVSWSEGNSLVQTASPRPLRTVTLLSPKSGQAGHTRASSSPVSPSLSPLPARSPLSASTSAIAGVLGSPVSSYFGSPSTSFTQPHPLSRAHAAGSTSSSTSGVWRLPSGPSSRANSPAGGGGPSASMTHNQGTHLDFDLLSDILIPKPELAHRLYVLRLSSTVTVASWPCVVEDPRYPRNKFLWNLGFVFEGPGEGVVCYEQVVRKIGRVLRSLELESQFLSNPASKQRLPQILEQIMEDLNAYHECQVTLDPITTISLKLFPLYPDPPPIDDWLVPVIVMPGAWEAADATWDLTLLKVRVFYSRHGCTDVLERALCFKVTPYIDGVRSIRRIADEGDIDINLCGMAVQHFVYYGIVVLVDIFQYSNVYTPTHRIRLLLDSQAGLATRCAQFSAETTDLSNSDDGRSFDSGAGADERDRRLTGLTAGVLFGMYAGMRHGLTIKEWAKRAGVGQRYKLDTRRFVLFGVLNGLIRRVHRYPVLVQTSQGEQQSTPATAVSPTPATMRAPGPPGAVSLLTAGLGREKEAPNEGADESVLERLTGLLDGTHHADDLCTKFRVGPKRLEELCDAVCRWLNTGGAGLNKSGDGLPWKVRTVWR